MENVRNSPEVENEFLKGDNIGHTNGCTFLPFLELFEAKCRRTTAEINPSDLNPKTFSVERL